MKKFRQAIQRCRWLVFLVLATTSFYSVEGTNYTNAYRQHRADEERLAELAERLGVSADDLRRDEPGLAAALRNLFSAPGDAVRAAGLARLEEQARRHRAQVEGHPFRDRATAVKDGYRLDALDALLADLVRVASLDLRQLSPAARRAVARNLRAALAEDLRLPEPEGLPPKARAAHSRVQAQLNGLRGRLQPILARPDALDAERLAQTLGELTVALDGEVRRPGREPRFSDRPLPLQSTERSAPRQNTDGTAAPATSSALVAAPSAAAPVRRIAAPSVAPEVAALAAELGSSPGRIFAHVHDTIRFDPKWGAVRPPRGTLLEGEGTAWDQAWLLADLLAAAGVEARLEWGEVEIPADLLTNLTGITDPFRAADLLATGGVPIVLLVEGSRPVAARIQHVWVVAHVDYIPHRGATSGTPDQWVRMDPSLKRYDHAPGLDVHEQVPFDLGEYLVSGTPLSPRRAYEDALWSYIRANDIACTTLEQLKRQPNPRAERFPYLPGTLRGKIRSVAGTAPAVPDAFQHRVRLAVRTASGGELVAWEAAAAQLYGRRVEVTYAGATADDQATIDAHGGVFETPPYLIDLRPVIRVDGGEVASGGAVASASDTEVWITLSEATGESRVLTHTGFAGERHVLALDLGQLPAALLDDHRQALAAALTAGNADAAEGETLYLLGAQYLHDLGRDLTDLAGWKHHRLVRLGTEGLITQRGQVTATIGGAPLSFARAARNVDIASMLLGLFHADGESAYKRQTFELLGSQSSFREGEVFATLLEREGIAAVSALTRSRREGQELARVDSGNLEAVLAAVDLGAGVEDEVRHAVGQGRIAWVAETPVGVDRWRGTGYVLEDPTTGAAGYLISGGYAGGDETGGSLPALQDLLGSEPWLEGSALGELLRQLLTLLGGGAGGGGGGDGPSTQQSDPINMSTGNLWMTETDLTVVARGLPIVWSRTYNSRSGHSGALGRGWTFSYGESLEERPDGSVLYRESDGTEHVFASGAGGAYVAPPGKHLTLSGDGAAGWSLRTKDGLVSSFASDGRLLSIEDPNRNRVTLGYDGAGGLQTVTDAAGRTVLTVTTEAGRITRVTDLSGRSVAFAYDGPDLVAVTDTVGETWAYAYDETGNLLARTDPLGNTHTYSHDGLDRCYRHVDPLGHEERFSYARRGERAVLTDRRGFDTYLEFDERGRATLQVDPLGNAARSTWDEGNNRASTTDPRGGVTTRSFDERGNLLSETNPLGQTTAHTYDPVFNRVLTTTDPTGHAVTNAYDGEGNLTETRQTVGGQLVIETYAYDGQGQLVERTDPNGNTTTFSWDVTKGSLESQTDALGQTTAISTDDVGRVTSITDPGGNQMSVVWDGRDRMVATTDPHGNSIAIGFDAAGRQVSMTTPRGTTTTAHDAAGRPIAATDVLGNTSRTVYDPAGLALERIDALGHATATTYDPVGRAATHVDPLGATWTFGYCAEIGGGCAGGSCGGSPAGSDVCELTDPLGNTSVQDFDVLGRVVRRTDPLGNVTVLGYDERGRHTSSTDPLGKITRYEYDDLNRLTAVVEANGARTEYTYDAVGNLTNVRDAEGRDWPRTYDELGRQITEADPLGNTTTSTYDALGNLATRQNANGDLVRYEYDLRRLTAIVLPDGSRETFGHDTLGRRTSMSNAEVSLSMVYDALDRMTAVTNQTLGQTVSYEYDPLGSRTAMHGPMGRVDYRYDARRQLVEQVDPATGTYRLAYDPAGRRTGLTYPNGVATEYAYDGASRLLTQLTRDPQGQVLDGFAYAYDPASRRTEMRSLRDSVLHTYAYDEVDRLTRWQRGDSRFEQYSYDGVGNRLELLDDRGSVTYSYDTANRLLAELRQLSDGGSTATDYTWDDAGRLISRQIDGGSVTNHTWDALDRLLTLDGPTGHHTYGYDPTGIRVRETNGATINRFLHAGEDILAAYQGGALDTYFAHGPGIDEPWAQLTPGTAADTSLAFLHRDALGSVTALSTPEGTLHATASYAAFGSVDASSGSTGRYGYTSREADPTGVMYYRARYLADTGERFLSRDPARPSLVRPASLNRYPYTENNPITYTDPDGRSPLPSKVAGALAVMNIIILMLGACTLLGLFDECFLAITSWFLGSVGQKGWAALLGRAGIVISFVLLTSSYWYEYLQGTFTADELVFMVGWTFTTHLAILMLDWVVDSAGTAVTSANFLLLAASIAVTTMTKRIVERIEAGELRR